MDLASAKHGLLVTGYEHHEGIFVTAGKPVELLDVHLHGSEPMTQWLHSGRAPVWALSCGWLLSVACRMDMFS